MNEVQRVLDLLNCRKYALSPDAKLLPLLFPVFDKGIVHLYKPISGGTCEKLFTIIPGEEQIFGIHFMEWIRDIVEAAE